MRRRAVRLLGATALIAAACWSYSVSIARSAELTDQSWPLEMRQALYGPSQGSQVEPYH